MSSLCEMFAKPADQATFSKIERLVSSFALVSPTRKSIKRIRDNDEPRDENPRATIEVIEVVDIEKLQIVYENRLKLLENGQQQSVLINYYNNTMAHKGRRPVTYKQKDSGNGFGRFSPQNGTSLQNIRKEIRSTIASHLYKQLDISNAHPWLLLSHTEDLGWDTPCLRSYVSNRADVLASLEGGNTSAKRVMLAIIYGGDAEHIFGNNLPFFVEEFRKELATIAKRLYEMSEPLVKRLRCDELDIGKRYHSFLAKLLQDKEAQCLRAAVEFLRKEGWQPGALLHDGLLVLNRTDATIDDNLLNRLATYVETSTSNRNIRFQLKEFDSGFDLTQFEKKNLQHSDLMIE